MANEKILDMTKSAAANETAVNEKFEELGQGGGEITPPAMGDHIGCSYEDPEGNGEAITGDNIANTIFPSRILTDINSINLIGDVADSHMCVSMGELNGATKQLYGHEPQMVISSGYAYLAYMYQEELTGSEHQAQGKSKVRLAKIDLADNSIISQVIVAEKDDTISIGGTSVSLRYAGSPNIVVIGDVIRVIFTAAPPTQGGDGRDETRGFLAYRDYNTSLVAQTSIGVCRFTKDSVDYDFTVPNYDSQFNETSNGLQAHCQYALINGKYYIAVTGETNVNIFTTTDFKEFEWFAKPDLGSYTISYEMPIFPWDDASGNVLLYFAARTTNGTVTLVGAMHTGLKYSGGSFSNNGETVGTNKFTRELDCSASRPCWFTWADSDFAQTRDKNNLYLMLNAGAQPERTRKYTNVAMLYKNALYGYNVSLIAQCLRMTYPSICYDATEKCYYVAYQSQTDNNYWESARHIYISRFSPFKATWNRVVPMLRKMLDTFEPSES